jgi:hypothetical protein
MSNKFDIRAFEEDIADTIAKHSKRVTTDEMIGTLELQLSALQEALGLEGIEPA